MMSEDLRTLALRVPEGFEPPPYPFVPVRAVVGLAPPFVVYQTISGSPDYTIDGKANLVWARAQIDCYADGYSEVRQIDEEVFDRISGFKGVIGHTNFRQTMCVDHEETFEASSGLYRTRRDWQLAYRRA